MTTEPTVGRIVHYAAIGTDGYRTGQPLAAIITEVFPPEKDQPRHVRLDIRWTIAGEPMPVQGWIIPYAEEPTPGHWNWPPRA